MEPEGSRFGKGVVDYSPAWFMQAQTVSPIHPFFACLTKSELNCLAIEKQSSRLS